MAWTARSTHRNVNGNLYVRYLYWNGGKWNWNYNWLVHGFDSSDPAAVLAIISHFSPDLPGEFCF